MSDSEALTEGGLNHLHVLVRLMKHLANDDVLNHCIWFNSDSIILL